MALGQGIADAVLNTATATAQAPVIENALSAQEKMLNSLLETISLLEDRLITVTTSTPNKEPRVGGVGTERPVVAHVSARIRQNTDVVEFATARIREIISRLEV